MVIHRAFRWMAMSQRVSGVTLRTSTYWAFVSGPIVAWSAFGVRATWVWFADLPFFEWAAMGEWIAGQVLGAAADWGDSS